MFISFTEICTTNLCSARRGYCAAARRIEVNRVVVDERKHEDRVSVQLASPQGRAEEYSELCLGVQSLVQQLKPALLQLEISGLRSSKVVLQVRDFERWKNGEKFHSPPSCETCRHARLSERGSVLFFHSRQQWKRGTEKTVVSTRRSIPKKFSELHVNTKRSVMTHLDGEPRISVEKAVGPRRTRSNGRQHAMVT